MKMQRTGGRPSHADILAEVRANLAVLDSCRGPHEFVRDAGRPGRYVCALCGGSVPADAKYWYEVGLAHGRRRDGATTTDRPLTNG